jgi:hypothetical protein
MISFEVGSYTVVFPLRIRGKKLDVFGATSAPNGLHLGGAAALIPASIARKADMNSAMLKIFLIPP